MKRSVALIALLLSIVLLAGCAPQDCLFPLFTKSDRVFEARLLGEWTVQGGTEMKPAEKSGHAIFEKAADEISYQITIPDLDEPGEKLVSTGRLVKLGNHLFLDLETPEVGSQKNPLFPYPIIESHVFGRIEVEQNKMRIDFLSNQWVSDRAKAGNLVLSSVTVKKEEGSLKLPDQIVLTATTEELRKFALEHAEDKEAFSEHFVFGRKE